MNGGPQTPSLPLCPLSWQPALGRGDRRPLNCRCLDHQQEEDPASSPPWEGLPCISASTSQPLQPRSCPTVSLLALPVPQSSFLPSLTLLPEPRLPKEPGGPQSNSCSSCCISAAQHGMQLGDLSSHAVCLPKGHSPPPMQPLLGPGLAPAFSPRSPSQGLAFRPPDVFVCPASCLAHRFLLCVWFSKLAYWTQDRHISLTAPPAALGTLVSLLFFS